MIKILTWAKSKRFCGFLIVLCVCAGLLSGCEKLFPAVQTETPEETGRSEQIQTETKIQTEPAAESEETAITTGKAPAETTAEFMPENDFVWEDVLSLDFIPPYSGEPAVIINGNVPFFTEAELQLNTAFTSYSELDGLGRCGPAFGCVGAELQPSGEREPNDHIHPSGMKNTTYDFVDKLFLYNRCHLIAYSIAGSNGDPRNLITGTRYMNTKGMLPYENKVLLYIEQTGNHVLYHVTPVFEGENLVVSGVLMEAYSVEDAGSGLMYCIYAYNVQPGVRIDYLTGDNEADGSFSEESEVSEEDCRYILNTRTQKIHLPDCESVKKISPLNKKPTNESLEELKKKGFEPCGYCLHGK